MQVANNLHVLLKMQSNIREFMQYPFYKAGMTQVSLICY